MVKEVMKSSPISLKQRSDGKKKSRQKQTFSNLCEKDGDEYGSNGRPETHQLNNVPQASSARILPVGGRAIGKTTVDEDGPGSVDVGNVDNALVERVVAAVSNEAVVVRSVVVIVATADIIRAASAENVSRLIATAGLVVVVVWMVVGVHVRAVQPDAGPEREGGTSEDGKWQDARGAPAAGAVGSRRTTSIISATAERWLRAAASN